MTIYASRTAASLNVDPMAVVHPDTGERYPTGFRPPYVVGIRNPIPIYDPRPEYTPQTTHEANPILAAWRLVGIDEREEYTREVEQLWLETTTGTLAPNVVVHATVDQIDHAHRVLQRLKHWTAAVPLGESA
jgi:hypothetical protein